MTTREYVRIGLENAIYIDAESERHALNAGPMDRIVELLDKTMQTGRKLGMNDTFGRFPGTRFLVVFTTPRT